METLALETPQISPPAKYIMAREAQARATILVAEDAADTRLILTRALEFDNYECLQASTGSEAFEKAIRYKPDLMLLDLMLPKLNGFQVLMRLKHLDILTKVCIISAIDKEDFVRRALNFGAVDYFVKPIVPETIGNKVKKLLGDPEAENYFRVLCSLTGNIIGENESHSCHIREISEADLTLETEAPLRKGDIVSLNCPRLNTIVGRESPIFIRVSRAFKRVPKKRFFDFDGEIVGLSEWQRQKLRAEIIRGNFIIDASV